MIDFAILPVYLTAVIALLLLPGPDMLLIASSSISFGRKVGVFASLGNATSGVILTVLAAMGVSALIAMNPLALQALHLLGGAYLLKMGTDCLRADADTAPDLDGDSAAKTYYQRALVSNLLNPKALVFFVVFLPQFVSSNIEASSGEQMLMLGLLLNVLGLTFNFLLVGAVGTVGKRLLENQSFRMYQHKVMGCVFIALSLWMLSNLLMH